MIAIRKNQTLRNYEPTRTDIRRECETIQATWSPQKRAKRSRRQHAAEWLPPTVRLSDLVDAMNAERVDGAAWNDSER